MSDLASFPEWFENELTALSFWRDRWPCIRPRGPDQWKELAAIVAPGERRFARDSGWLPTELVPYAEKFFAQFLKPTVEEVLRLVDVFVFRVREGGVGRKRKGVIRHTVFVSASGTDAEFMVSPKKGSGFLHIHRLLKEPNASLTIEAFKSIEEPLKSCIRWQKLQMRILQGPTCPKTGFRMNPSSAWGNSGYFQEMKDQRDEIERSLVKSLGVHEEQVARLIRQKVDRAGESVYRAIQNACKSLQKEGFGKMADHLKDRIEWIRPVYFRYHPDPQVKWEL